MIAPEQLRRVLTRMYRIRYNVQHMPPIARLDAIFFRTVSGNEPVRDWLRRLTKEERKAIGEDIAYVQFKWPIGKPRVDCLRGAIWEVRTSLSNRIARTLFAVKGTRMILLHGFIKKTQRTSNDDIALAEKRFKEWQHGER